jgi:hypothetical protein
MGDFSLYFKLGFEHVLDWNAYDHVLFITVLCASYTFASWKKLLLLVTLFTLGHTVSLFLSNYGWTPISPAWIEFLIPVTILTTAVYNILDTRSMQPDRNFSKKVRKQAVIYVLTVFFGIIHGFGFGRYFNQINDEQALAPLFEFALGIEASQLVIVLAVLVFGYVINSLFRLKKRTWIWAVSILVMVLTLPMLIENWPFNS